MLVRKYVCALALAWWMAAAAPRLEAQDAKEIVQHAVRSEMAAAKADRSLWRYRMSEDGDNEFVVVETADGSIKRHVIENGKPASAATVGADNQKIEQFVHDPSVRAKQKKDDAHDDQQAAELLTQMPTAFLWKVESETPEYINLSYAPNPGFSPPDMESRVMGGMSGTLVVVKNGFRIKTFKGRLQNDVTIGYGLVARLKAGGIFDIERSQVGEGYWEITETHVHISGHALFFKTISTNQDEVKTHFTPVPQGTTLEQAVALLDAPLR